MSLSHWLGFLGVAALGIGCGDSSQEGAAGAETTGKGGDGGSTASEGGGGSGGTTTSMSSSGSGGAPPMTCSGKKGASGDSVVTLDFEGKMRNAEVHVPASVNAENPTSLVLNFHGFSSNASQEALLSLMNTASDERGFIVVYPNGIDFSWNAGKCCGNAASLEINDVGFVSALIDKLSADYCIDPKRVFATGMSNGGFLTNRLGCDLSEKIAAIAPVAGVLGIPLSTCSPGRKVPVMHFHGTADLLVPYEGGGVLDFPSVEKSIGRWREINSCGAASEVIFDKGDSECITALDCAEGADVTLCTVQNGGHTWPGGTPVPAGGITSMDLDATNQMLDFFEKHPML